MANDTVRMNIMFQACYDILDEILVPIHYKDLTILALQKLNVNIQDVNLKRQIEDVREKMVSIGRMGTFYTGSPMCLVGIKQWFENEQLYLLNGDITKPVIILGNINSGIAGAFESLMRYPHMLQKNSTIPEKYRVMGCARGLVIEHHVIDWFRLNWPDLILPPDNDQKWSIPCSHDFKIRTDQNSIILVDVWGPNKAGRYTKPPMKKSTHLHLQCRIYRDGLIWESVIPGKSYDENMTLPEVGISPRRLIVWLNCIKNNLPYEEIKRFA